MNDSDGGSALQQAAPCGPLTGSAFSWWPAHKIAGCGGCGHLRRELDTETQARDWLDGHLDVCDPTPAGRETWNRAVLLLSVLT